ncbi:MAG TPA: carbamoyltransferase HypF [Steroidobacteraceae bacterium]|nr:carbamoyltransferase HypF [Steroidobacteraceae bacterium]
MNATPGARLASVAGENRRLRIRVRGVVQGVGFRPFVYRVARELALCGSVCNDASGVLIDAQGAAPALEELIERLRHRAPPRARVDAVEHEECPADPARTGFDVIESREGQSLSTAIGHDTATCPSCLAELFDPTDRRYRYAFTNCTDCGPRFTVTRALPYDRPLTSLAPFPLCAACEVEYRAPGDRRFHAEATACPACGPRLTLVGGEAGEDPIAGCLRLLRDGRIVAIKGLGGYHLACDARNPGAVARLRARKHREEQPFALMAANVASLAGVAAVAEAERTGLESAERPIVLTRRAEAASDTLPGIADGLAQLGVMLPYTPIQFLLFHEAAGRPAGTGWLSEPQALLLVMTSANVHGEPLVTDDREALEALAGIADAWLAHDREIVTRCDDTVVRVRDGATRFVRRARGAAPRAVALARGTAPVLGVGAHYKATACVTRGAEAFLTPHVGDLDLAATRRALDASIEHLLALTQVRPAAVAHDLHPDFHSTRRAAALAAAWDVPLVGVQHHHAHVAAVLAEHRHEGPALGLALDGVGYGSDGGAWGGELLRVDGADCARLGHLRALPLVGGDRAAREPWRMAAAALAALGAADSIATRFADQPLAPLVAQRLARPRALLVTSSLGRWFDAAAGLLGLKAVTSFEGQAAMLLEGLATCADASRVLPGCPVDADGVLDLLPLLAPLVAATDQAQAAADFHAGLAVALADWAARAAAAQGLTTVACGGGCLMNDVLARRLRDELGRRGLAMLEAAEVPPNDGAISLGQCWVAQRTRS